MKKNRGASFFKPIGWRSKSNTIYFSTNENRSITAVRATFVKAVRSFGTALLIQFSSLGANLPLVAQESAGIGEETVIREAALISF